VKEKKIVLSDGQMELLRQTLVTALEEAPPTVKELISNDQLTKLEQEKKKSEQDWGLVF